MNSLVMLMGYTATEARRGLRSAQGNLDQAIEFIIEVTVTIDVTSNPSSV